MIGWYTLFLVSDTLYFWKQNEKISYFAVQMLFNISFENNLDGSDSRCLTLLSLGSGITTMKRPVKQARRPQFRSVNLFGQFFDEMSIVSVLPVWLRHGLPEIRKTHERHIKRQASRCAREIFAKVGKLLEVALGGEGNGWWSDSGCRKGGNVFNMSTSLSVWGLVVWVFLIMLHVDQRKETQKLRSTWKAINDKMIYKKTWRNIREMFRHCQWTLWTLESIKSTDHTVW